MGVSNYVQVVGIGLAACLYLDVPLAESSPNAFSHRLAAAARPPHR
jgi:hypothetical protein